MVVLHVTISVYCMHYWCVLHALLVCIACTISAYCMHYQCVLNALPVGQK